MGNAAIPEASRFRKVGSMFRKIAAVYPLSRLRLLVWFTGGEAKEYDMSRLVNEVPAFAPLADEELFSQVKVDAGGYGISWNDRIDLACNELFDNGCEVDILEREKARLLADVARSRKGIGLSQGAAGEASGVSQPVIARMETGSVAPQLDTILKVLGPLGKTLHVVDLDEITR